MATTWAWPIKLMKKATGLVFGRADTRDSKPVAFFIGLGSQACEEGHRLVFVRPDNRDSKLVAFFTGLGSQACEEVHGHVIW